jgi:cyclic dehypoxanthinyl futalosine synthase
MPVFETLYNRVCNGETLNREELLVLYKEAPLSELMYLAHSLRNKIVANTEVTWQIDRNVNITNVCVSGCKFCNFHCKLSDKERSYITSKDEYYNKIEELKKFGGSQLLLQGGHHPKLGLDFYKDLFSDLKKHYPEVKLHALGPPEIAHIARLEKCSYREVLEELVDSGLDSLPGAGAEILVDRVRKKISPGKPNVQAWLDVMHEAHKLNLTTSATMMFGHIETVEERIDHLVKIRDLQSIKPENSTGFLAFIPWPYQDAGTPLKKEGWHNIITSVDYVRLLAISRIALTNITNIQASWLTVGKTTAQMCLHAGANDFGSIMIEENVVSSAGADNNFDAIGIQKAILEAGFKPQLRNQKYEFIETPQYAIF